MILSQNWLPSADVNTKQEEDTPCAHPGEEMRWAGEEHLCYPKQLVLLVQCKPTTYNRT